MAALHGVHGRRIPSELAKLLGKRVEVITTSGRRYRGVLRDFDYPSLTLLLSDAEHEEGKSRLVIVAGQSVSEIRAQELPLFDPSEFAQYLVRRLGLRPDAVRVLEDAGVVLVYNTIRVTEGGVEGSGGLVPKIDFVLKEYLAKKARGEEPL